MQYILVILVAALVFGACYLLDKGFTKLFRSKVQHFSGLSVRASKRYGSVGLILAVLGVAAIFAGINGEGTVMLAGGAVVLVVGICLVVYYMTFGIFYDEDSFLLTTFGRKSTAYRYQEIKGQMLYVSGSSVVIELHMTDGRTVALQSGMEGVYPFLDKAFARWCAQKSVDPEGCEFHDTQNHIWFPMEG